MFIKHGDGKIVAVIPEEELTEEQKIATEKSKKQVIKPSVNSSTIEKSKD